MLKKILNVPKIKQQRFYCVPTSVTMVLNYYGLQVTQEDVAKGLNRRGDGFRDQDILPYVRGKGLVAHPYSEFSINGLVSLIERDILPIVRTTCLSDPGQAHMSVIKGYDLSSNELYFNDPCDLSRFQIDFKTFEGIWEVNNSQGYSINYTISIHPK